MTHVTSLSPSRPPIPPVAGARQAQATQRDAQHDHGDASGQLDRRGHQEGGLEPQTLYQHAVGKGAQGWGC